MEYTPENYIGRKIQLYPSDTYCKYGIILDLDDLGFIIKITHAHQSANYKPGDIIFINHKTNIIFKILKG